MNNGCLKEKCCQLQELKAPFLPLCCVLRDTNLDWGRGLCTSAHSRPGWAAAPTWSGRTCQPGNSRKPGRTTGWGLEGVQGNGIEREKRHNEGKRHEGSCIINYKLQLHMSSDMPANFPHLSSSAGWGKLSFECTIPLRETILDQGGRCYSLLTNLRPFFTGDPLSFKSHNI